MNILLYSGLLAAMGLLYLMLIYFHPELVDAFYYRFTTPKAGSLILGTSRSAQGIRPSVINNRFKNEYTPIINHSFALGPSSFGPNYYREIIKKLQPVDSRGLFIISVDPWGLATDVRNVNDDSTQFFEVKQKLFVGNLRSSSTNPNLDYLYKYWVNKFSPFVGIFKRMIHYKNILTLHANGWLEADIKMDTAVINQRIRESTQEYSEKHDVLSPTRFLYLVKMVKLLSKYGQVYLVRMPVSAPMAKLEKKRYPDFDELVQEIAAQYHVAYFNFINESGQYRTVDTHHLYKDETKGFTNKLCDSIAAYRSKMIGNLLIKH